MTIERGKHDPSIPDLDLGDERMDPLAYEYKHGFDQEGHVRQDDETAEQVASELKKAKPGLARVSGTRNPSLGIQTSEFKQ